MKVIESYHTSRVFSQEEFSFAMEMLDTYPWISRPFHRRGFDEMIDRLIRSSDERELLRVLLERFVYIDIDSCEELLRKITMQITESWGCRPDDTVIMASRLKPKENDGSVVFLKQLQDRLYGWKERNFVNIYEKGRCFPTVKDFHNIILVDDFIGSGSTMSDRYETLLKELSSLKSKRNVYVVAIAGMSVAKENYSILSSNKVYVPLWIEKAFDRIVDKNDTAIMDRVLDRLHRNNSNGAKYRMQKYKYGFNDTVGLYYNVHYRIPNNVLPLFWWSRFNDQPEEYHSMFRRT